MIGKMFVVKPDIALEYLENQFKSLKKDHEISCLILHSDLLPQENSLFGLKVHHADFLQKNAAWFVFDEG